MAPLITAGIGALAPAMGALSAAAPFLKVAGPLIGFGGGILSSIRANQHSEMAAASYEQNAKEQRRKALYDANQLGRQNRAQLSGLFTHLTAGSGLQAGGSPAAILRQYSEDSARNEFMTRFGGEVAASSLKSYAKAERHRGKSLLYGGIGQATGTLLGHAGTIRSGLETIQADYG